MMMLWRDPLGQLWMQTQPAPEAQVWVRARELEDQLALHAAQIALYVTPRHLRLSEQSEDDWMDEQESLAIEEMLPATPPESPLYHDDPFDSERRRDLSESDARAFTIDRRASAFGWLKQVECGCCGQDTVVAMPTYLSTDQQLCWTCVMIHYPGEEHP